MLDHQPLPGFATGNAPGRTPDRQRSLDDLGTPLAEVTFAVLDLETTGTSPRDAAITEIGAVRVRGGVPLGTFQTLVNPGVPVPPTITVLTGITEAMVLPAPRIDAVLAPLLEFLGDAVLVGHNLRFDTSFLDAALARRGDPPLPHRRVDTLALARRLVRDEVPDLRLATLARHFRVATRPEHRALADARATVEVLHALIERASALGVLGLDDLLALPTVAGHPSAAKLGLTEHLPRRPGVYLFRDRRGDVLYVGKATDLRSRVRSYFSSDARRKVPQLLRETARIDHLVCADPLEAAVREVRLIRDLAPRFNRAAKAWRRYVYVRLTDERFPRLAVSRNPPPADGAWLGPLPSRRAADLVVEAIQDAVPLRRCSARVSRRTVIVTASPCPAAQLGVATCPCRGQVDDDAYAQLVDQVHRGIGCEPELLLAPLRDRMRRLADAERFEEAGAARDRLAALTRAIRHRRLVSTVRAPARIVLDTGAGPLELCHGRLRLDAGPAAELLVPPADPAGPPEREEIDELLIVARWLARDARGRRVEQVHGTLASPIPAVPAYGERGGRRVPGRPTASVRTGPAGFAS